MTLTLKQRLTGFVNETIRPMADIFSYNVVLATAGLVSVIVVAFFGFTTATLVFAVAAAVVAGLYNGFFNAQERSF